MTKLLSNAMRMVREQTLMGFFSVTMLQYSHNLLKMAIQQAILKTIAFHQHEIQT
jgi:hypothetical protein